MDITANTAASDSPARAVPALPATTVATTPTAAAALAATEASSVVSLSAQALQLAASTSSAQLPLPDLDGIAKVDQALAGVPDTSAAQARNRAQLAREADKLKHKFSMLDVDAFRYVRDRMRAQQQQRPDPSTEQQKADEAAYKQRLDDSQPLG